MSRSLFLVSLLLLFLAVPGSGVAVACEGSAQDCCASATDHATVASPLCTPASGHECPDSGGCPRDCNRCSRGCCVISAVTVIGGNLASVSAPDVSERHQLAPTVPALSALPACAIDPPPRA